MANIKFEVREHIGTLYSTIRGRREGTGWSKQVNLVSWNGNPPKIDIRDWSEDLTKMSKGITLTREEAREVMELLQAYFNGRDGE